MVTVLKINRDIIFGTGLKHFLDIRGLVKARRTANLADPRRQNLSNSPTHQRQIVPFRKDFHIRRPTFFVPKALPYLAIFRGFFLNKMSSSYFFGI